MTTQSKQDEITSIHKEYKWFYPFIGGMVILVIGIFIGLSLFPNNHIDYSVNLYTEIISVLITLVILDRINEYRETQRLKKRLIREAGSQSNETAKAAVDWLRAEGWITVDKGLLKGANLTGANLKDAKLTGANLVETNLQGANLLNAQLNSSNLTRADLRGANLKGANLSGTFLKESYLDFANMAKVMAQVADFTGASMENVYLEEADLYRSNLSKTALQNSNFMRADIGFTEFVGANLRHAMFSGSFREDRVILPNGEIWLKDDDIERFINPDHPDFWQPV